LLLPLGLGAVALLLPLLPLGAAALLFSLGVLVSPVIDSLIRS
jgi:hypothetical protein